MNESAVFYGRGAGRSTKDVIALGDGAKRLHVIVFANEKGGTGKSTTAVHTAIALAAKGARVACFDLDHRQRTMGRYLDNRQATITRTGRELPMPRYETHDGESLARFSESLERLGQGTDFLVIDTPGRDDRFARIAVTNADTLVTPMNDSFVDFDLIGQVDPETFRVISGLSERVVYRELFPQGLTMLDSREFGDMGLSHVAARQELREMMSGLALPEVVMPLFA